MAIVEALLGVLLLAAAAFVAGAHDGLASVLVTLAVATVASLGVIEPATTAAAEIGERELHARAARARARAIGVRRARRAWRARVPRECMWRTTRATATVPCDAGTWPRRTVGTDRTSHVARGHVGTVVQSVEHLSRSS
jgi:hypothetical protein